MILRFADARTRVLNTVPLAQPESEAVPLDQAAGRVLAATVVADRDYPPFPRATRDGYALRSSDVAETPAQLKLIGEVQAGSVFAGQVEEGECVSIMTGAPAPQGCNAVVMVEYTHPMEDGRVMVERTVLAWENIVPKGSEAAAGTVLLEPGRRIRYPEIALMASVGCTCLQVYRRPRVAIIATGDEVVELDQAPRPYQIRNSNSYSLRTQVAAAGGDPWPLPIAPDESGRLRELIEMGLTADLLLLSGGVSMGKFDLVEGVLRELGAEVFFDGVLIQPGKPLLFGQARGKYFFGLPGNPLSTMVCFELFARPALERLAGIATGPLGFLRARLASAVKVKSGLTRFLPALIGGGYSEPSVEVLGWKGSGDLAAMVKANGFLVVPEDRDELKEGEWVGVLPREV